MKTINKDNSELVMCGKGPLWGEITSDPKYKIPNINFPGFVTEEQKAKYLASADIAVFPSTGGESFGIVLTEAMSAGAGVTLGGNNPGYSSVLGDWPETLFDPDNIEEFARTLDRFLNSVSLRDRVGSLQHKAVVKYDIARICEQLERAYCQPNKKHA
jgi:phosphatidylinositol alpha-mannosyltransferase